MDYFSNYKKPCKAVTEILDSLENFIKEGISTYCIEEYCSEKIKEYNVRSATVGYKGYKYSTCISVNHIVCHGLPSKSKILKNGDIVKVDLAVKYNGYFCDSCRTYKVGKTSVKANILIEVARNAVLEGIKECYPGNYIINIGKRIQNYVTENGFFVFPEFVGHGFGKDCLHGNPVIYHTYFPNIKDTLKPGMVFTIEPIISYGKCTKTRLLQDNWSIAKCDRNLSAQFRHTIGITDTGCIVLTDKNFFKY